MKCLSPDGKMLDVVVWMLYLGILVCWLWCLLVVGVDEEVGRSYLFGWWVVSVRKW